MGNFSQEQKANFSYKLPEYLRKLNPEYEGKQTKWEYTTQTIIYSLVFALAIASMIAQ